MGGLFDAPMPADELYSEAIEVWDNARARNPIDRTLEFFSNFYLQGDILAKTDRAAMMVSLETRAVFLDNDVVDFCAGLPHGYKYRRGVRKFLLRRAAEGLVPDTVLKRPKKGFGIPLARWLRQMPPPPLEALPGLRPAWIAERWAGVAERAGRRNGCWFRAGSVFQGGRRPEGERRTLRLEAEQRGHLSGDGGDRAPRPGAPEARDALWLRRPCGLAAVQPCRDRLHAGAAPDQPDGGQCHRLPCRLADKLSGARQGLVLGPSVRRLPTAALRLFDRGILHRRGRRDVLDHRDRGPKLSVRHRLDLADHPRAEFSFLHVLGFPLRRETMEQPNDRGLHFGKS